MEPILFKENIELELEFKNAAKFFLEKLKKKHFEGEGTLIKQQSRFVQEQEGDNHPKEKDIKPKRTNKTSSNLGKKFQNTDFRSKKSNFVSKINEQSKRSEKKNEGQTTRKPKDASKDYFKTKSFINKVRNGSKNDTNKSHLRENFSVGRKDKESDFKGKRSRFDKQGKSNFKRKKTVDYRK